MIVSTKGQYRFIRRKRKNRNDSAPNEKSTNLVELGICFGLLLGQMYLVVDLLHLLPGLLLHQVLLVLDIRHLSTHTHIQHILSIYLNSMLKILKR